MYPEIIKEHFFYIDSDSLDNVETKLYGYAYGNQDSIDSYKNDVDAWQKLHDGSYVLVQNFAEKIIISQDFLGSYGLYFYEKDGFFAISNSFLMLADKLRGKYPLTLNKEYAEHFLFVQLTTLSYSGTMINEIRLLPRNEVLIINKNNKNIAFKQKDFSENTISLESKEGIEILDAWRNKWVGFIKNLSIKNSNMLIDVTGGFDSRTVLALILSANIDLSKVTFNSLDDGIHTHNEDLEIAKSMADYFNFYINKSTYERDVRPLTINESISIPFFVKLGTHKELNYSGFRHNNPLFYFGGAGGESIRNHWDLTPGEFIKDYLLKEKGNPIAYKGFYKSMKSILSSSFEETKNKNRYNKDDEFLVNYFFYKDTRCRSHFGKDMVNNYMLNSIRCNPIIDSLLQKLKIEYSDKDLLIATIFSRYCPELLKFKFDSGKSISKETIKEADRLNKIFPFDNHQKEKETFILMEKEYNSNTALKSVAYNDKNTSISQCINLINNIFNSDNIKNKFIKYFSHDYYDYAYEYSLRRKHQPLAEIYAVLAVIVAIDACKIESNGGEAIIFNYINSYLDENSLSKNYFNKELYKKEILQKLGVAELLDYLTTAQIAIKNKNNTVNKSSIEIEGLESIGDFTILMPTWWTNHDGIGYLLQNTGGYFDIKIIPKNDGKLSLSLRTRDLRSQIDKSNRINYVIDYYKFIINDNDIINSLTPITHDSPYRIEFDVKKDEPVNLKISWKPHQYSLSEMKDIYKQFFG